jgi:ABC-type transport system involved in multi-copper enzyme maturation permease subunit
VITIARLTIGEAARRRVLWVLVVLALIAVGLTGWGVERLVSLARESGAAELDIRFGVSQVLIFIAFQFGFVLAMTAAFLGSPAIAADLESGVALALLARPLRRSSFLLGRWLGLLVVVVGYAIGSAALAMAVVGVVSGYVPPNPIVPIAYLAAQAVVLLTLTLALSTKLPPIGGGAVAVVVYGLAWFAGVLGGLGRALGAEALTSISNAVRYVLPTDGLWRGVVYGLEPQFIFAVIGEQGGLAESNPFFASSPPPTAFLAWCVAWVAIVLGLAIVALRRREL